jgi:uncharacterized protein (TIGR03000 family)
LYWKEKIMNRPSWKSLVFGAVIVVALFAVVNEANAWYGCCGSPVYGYPAVTAWDYGCCGGSSYLGIRPGPVRRVVLGPYRWYGGWYGGWGCCYPTYSCCYPTYSCCTEISSCCTGNYLTSPSVPGPIPQPTPAARKPVIDAPESPTPAPGPTDSKELENPPVPGADLLNPGKSTINATPETSGILTVWVPFDAKVTINGLATKSTGSRRQFVSYDLKEGFSYKYEVKAEVVRDGKIIEDIKTVVITAGDSTSVAFGFNILPAAGLATN